MQYFLWNCEITWSHIIDDDNATALSEHLYEIVTYGAIIMCIYGLLWFVIGMLFTQNCANVNYFLFAAQILLTGFYIPREWDFYCTEVSSDVRRSAILLDNRVPHICDGACVILNVQSSVLMVFFVATLIGVCIMYSSLRSMRDYTIV
jgi:hypothetical protein